MTEKREVFYSPESELRNPLTLFRLMFVDLIRSKDLIWVLFLRDFRARFRQDFLSYFWIVLPSLANTGMWVYLSAQNLIIVDETSIPYPLFVFTGQILWESFVLGIRSPRVALDTANTVITRLKVPLEGFVFSQLLIQSVEVFIKVVLLIPFLLIWGDGIPLTFPLFIINIIVINMLGVSLGMLIGPIGALLKDLHRVIDFLMPFLKFTAPVIFPMATTGIAGVVMQSNPVSHLIIAGRNWATTGNMDGWFVTLVLGVLSLVVFLVASMMLKLFMPRIVERLGM
jgi:lipopolysaccharide transport system permease protein